MNHPRILPAKKHVLFAAVVFVVAAALAQAQEKAASKPVIVGPGASSCGEWLGLRERAALDPNNNLKHQMVLAWVQGYVLGTDRFASFLRNQFPADKQGPQTSISGLVFDPPHPDAIEFWLVKFCQDQPLKHIDEAALALTADLMR